MKRKIIGIFVCTLLIVTMIPISGIADYETFKAFNITIPKSCDKKIVEYIGNGETLDQYQPQTSGLAWGLCPEQWIAQEFKSTLINLTRLKLYIYKADYPPADTIITVSIRETLNGTDLTSTDKVVDIFDPNPKWVEFNLTNLQLTPEHPYYIVARSDNCSMMGFYGWACGFNNPYNRGDAWIGDGEYYWEKLDYEEYPECDMCFMTYGMNEAPNIPNIEGQPKGKVGTEYNYTISTTDYEDHDIWYYIEWGDGTKEEWIGPYRSGIEINLTHTWDKMRIYKVKVKAKDIHDFESDWGKLKITIPKNRNIHHVWLDKFPLLQNILDVLRLNIL